MMREGLQDLVLFECSIVSGERLYFTMIEGLRGDEVDLDLLIHARLRLEVVPPLSEALSSEMILMPSASLFPKGTAHCHASPKSLDRPRKRR
jgi:hypothetical protein